MSRAEVLELPAVPEYLVGAEACSWATMAEVLGGPFSHPGCYAVWSTWTRLYGLQVGCGEVPGGRAGVCGLLRELDVARERGLSLRVELRCMGAAREMVFLSKGGEL